MSAKMIDPRKEGVAQEADAIVDEVIAAYNALPSRIAVLDRSSGDLDALGRITKAVPRLLELVTLQNEILSNQESIITAFEAHTGAEIRDRVKAAVAGKITL